MATHPKAYLDYLKFDPKLSQGLLASYLTNPRLVFILIFTIILVGITSYINLPRTLNPEVDIPLVVVSAALPGASPEEVEDLLTIPLEDAVNSVSDITQITSTSQNSVTSIIIEFTSSVDSDKAKQDVQSAIDSVTDLPEDATTPRVNKLDFENQPIWTFAITANNNSNQDASLNRFAQLLETDLKALSKVDRVIINGADTQEIQILIKPETIRSYKINPNSLSSAVKTALSSFPAGEIQSSTNNFTLTIDPQITSIEELRQLKINISGTTYQLSDLASINQTTTPGLFPTYYADAKTNPTKAIQVSVYKTSSANITDAIVDIEQKVDELMQEYPDQFQLINILNLGREIDNQFTELFSNFSSTIILVFITLFVFLGIRQALITSISIPLSFFITFAIMQATGISLNFLAIFSLLIALGLLVDDAIVIVAAMTRYYRKGKFTVHETGLLVWRDFIVPIWTTTITTVWAFAPLLLATGIIGEFIKSIPIIVSTALLSSTAIAVFITLPLMMLILAPNVPSRVKNTFKVISAIAILALLFIITQQASLTPNLLTLLILITLFVLSIKRQKIYQSDLFIKLKPFKDKAIYFLDNGFVNAQEINHRYRDIITKVLGSKTNRRLAVTFVIIFSIASYLLVPLGFVVSEFFPKTNEDILYIQLELPNGTTQNVTQSYLQQIQNEIKDEPSIESVTASVGQTAPTDGTSSGNSGSHQGLLTIRLPAEEKQTIQSIELAQDLRKKYANYNLGKLSVLELSSGPPAGGDIVLTLTGSQLSQLDEYANKTIEYLETQPGITSTSKSIQSGPSKITFVPDQSQLVKHNLSIAQIGGTLRNYVSGSTFEESVNLTSLGTTNQHEQNIIFRVSNQALTADQLSAISIITPSGEDISLQELGTFELRPNPTSINRIDGDREVTVNASVENSTQIAQINQGLEQFANTELGLAPGYAWQTGGVNEENQKSVQSIIQAMGLAAVLILATMVIQLGSFRKAILVLLVIPLAISGVFIIFALTGTPLSFPALIGLLALFGIVVNNSIVVIDKINENLKIGMDFIPAIADAAAGRLEAILFSSLTTVIGLLPITLSDPVWQGTGGAIISGLLFSGTIMLFFIPVVYYMWFASEYKVDERA